MENVEFSKITNEFIDKAKNIMLTKGVEYAGDADRLANFKRGAAIVGVNPETVLFIYMAKHWDSVGSFIKSLQSGQSLSDIEKKLSEPIEGRVMDINNYLWLLNALIEERRQMEAASALMAKKIVQ